MKTHIQLPGFGPLHIALALPACLFGMLFVGAITWAAVDVALHPPTPEERAARKAKRQAADAAEAQRVTAEAQREREAMGYIDDPKAHATAGVVIQAFGYSCPAVSSVRSMGDSGRGNVLRVHCNNNIFFLLTVRPRDQGVEVEIMD